MQDNFNIHAWKLKQAINELEEKQCPDCGCKMEGQMCNECGYMEEGATFTDKHDDNPKLKGGQKDLPDEVQAKIVAKEGHNSLQHVERIEEIIDNLVRNVSTNSTIPTESKIGLLRAFKELKGHIEDLGAEVEMGELSEDKKDDQKTYQKKYNSDKVGFKRNSESSWYWVKAGSAMEKKLDKKFEEEGYKLEKTIKEGEDHEVSMAQNSLKAIISSASQLMTKLGNNERDIPGWIQDHIAKSENYIEQANQSFHELENNNEED